MGFYIQVFVALAVICATYAGLKRYEQLQQSTADLKSLTPLSQPRACTEADYLPTSVRLLAVLVSAVAQSKAFRLRVDTIGFLIIRGVHLQIAKVCPPSRC